MTLENSRNFWTIPEVQEYSRRLLSIECKSRIFSKTDKFQNTIVLITEVKFLWNNSYFLFVLGTTGQESILCTQGQNKNKNLLHSVTIPVVIPAVQLLTQSINKELHTRPWNTVEHQRWKFFAKRLHRRCLKGSKYASQYAWFFMTKIYIRVKSLKLFITFRCNSICFYK